jgi:ribosome maturation factor RimP
MLSPLDPLTIRLRDEVARLGFDLVEARIAGTPRRRSVRLRIDRPDSRPGVGVTLGDCTVVSRALLRWFAESLPAETIDSLEVSSPGLERPVVFPEHWRRFVGERVRIRSRALPGRPEAVIRSVPDDGHVVLAVDGQAERTIALADIAEATLVVDWTRIR